VEVTVAAEELPVPGLRRAPGSRPPVEILGADSRRLQLADGASGTALFRLRAVQPVGAARLEVTASSGELVSHQSADLPLLASGPRSRRVERLELEAGTLDLTPYLTGWLPLSERTTFWVTPNPYADALQHLSYLLRYPYGCVEQTTSTTRPLLYLGELLPSIDPQLAAETPVDKMVMSGIERVLSMQTPSGGFAYWPGGQEPAYWASAYALHMLLDARNQRYPVPDQRIDEAVAWMERQVATVFRSGDSHSSHYSRNAEPYMHYVLALAGRPQKGRAERLLAELGPEPTGEAREHRTMLQAALYLAGDHRWEDALRHPDLSPVRDERHNGWSFYSDRRRRGFMLSTFVDLFGRDPAGEELAQLVAEALRHQPSRWYTTQELVWGVTGLGKYVEAGARLAEPPVLRANGNVLAPEAAPQASEKRPGNWTWKLARASEYERLSLEVPAKSEGALYLILSSEGVRQVADWRQGGDGLSLERRYLDADGGELDPEAGVPLGQVVFVELTLANTSAERIDNVALVDRLPAGLEIENPRLGRDRAVEWIDPDTLWESDHLDLRDDRIEVFGSLEKGASRKVLYAARAVTAGRFTLPGPSAEAMYDPRRWARGGEGRLLVEGPWGDDE
jgi:uncharacterized protein YfaS (alpha-2-macroglobulin family)